MFLFSKCCHLKNHGDFWISGASYNNAQTIAVKLVPKIVKKIKSIKLTFEFLKHH